MSAVDSESNRPHRAGRLRLLARVFRLAYLRFGLGVANLMAAAIAFYSLLCLGPLGLLLAALLQAVFGQGGESYRRLHAVIAELGGHAAGQLLPQLDAALSNPGTYAASLGSIALLVWASLQLFEVIERSLTEVWPGRLVRGFFGRKLVALTVMAAGGALICGVVLASVMRVAVEARLRQIPGLEPTTLEFVRPGLRFLVEFMASVVAFTLLYKFVPVQRVPFRVAFAGALFAALLWHLISPVFTHMLAWSERSHAIYGSLAQVVTFCMWAFLGARILLAGGHFAAAYDHVVYHQRPPEEDDLFLERRRKQQKS
ncbi:MAG: YihY/virulence factor BrkB family protein [candidate division WS1 bacterium]|nr:YihY/virulence factor BrkB family protein [candidate division WS1 bacterium]